MQCGLRAVHQCYVHVDLVSIKCFKPLIIYKILVSPKYFRQGVRVVMELRLGLPKQKSAVALPRGFKSHPCQHRNAFLHFVFIENDRLARVSRQRKHSGTLPPIKSHCSNAKLHVILTQRDINQAHIA